MERVLFPSCYLFIYFSEGDPGASLAPALGCELTWVCVEGLAQDGGRGMWVWWEGRERGGGGHECQMARPHLICRGAALNANMQL